jgi:hypothetical protein
LFICFFIYFFICFIFVYWDIDLAAWLMVRTMATHAGKKTNPHLVRDMIVTHIRSGDASEAQLEALAIFMGHSIETQKAHYDRRYLCKRNLRIVLHMLMAAGDRFHLPAAQRGD